MRDGGWSGFGLAVDATRERLWVATSWQPHNTRLARGTGTVTLIAHSKTDALNGIGGMILRGDRLLGVQNGVNPNRVIAMQLDAASGGCGCRELAGVRRHAATV